MGLLSQGSPLSWEKTQRHAEHVRKHGILQFLHIYWAVGERHKDLLKWGDEMDLIHLPKSVLKTKERNICTDGARDTPSSIEISGQ